VAERSHKAAELYGRGGQVVEPAAEAALEAAFIEQGWGGEL
jgi:hypothetical protein